MKRKKKKTLIAISQHEHVNSYNTTYASLFILLGKICRFS